MNIKTYAHNTNLLVLAKNVHEKAHL